MYKVIIAEDEYLALMGIRMIVDWRSLGLELVGEAANGEEAYQLYLQQQPHIIITDLRMPVMDGIGLIARVRDDHCDKETRFIILSCVDEFSLVQKALNYNVSHYFLKIRMTREEINAVLKQLVQELDQYYSRLSINSMAEEEQFAEDLLKSAYDDRLDVEGAACFLSRTGLYSEGSLYQCVLISTNRPGTAAKPDHLHAEASEIVKTINEAVHRTACRIYHLDSNLYCLFMQIPAHRIHDLQKDPSAISEFIRDYLKKNFNLISLFGISNIHQKAGELSAALAEAQNGLDGCFFLGIPICQCQLSRRRYTVDPVYLDQIRDMLVSDGKLEQDTVNECLDRLIASLKTDYSTAEEFKDALQMLLFWFVAKVQTPGHELDQLIRSCKKRIAGSLFLYESISVLKDFIKACTGNASFGKKIPEVILTVTNYINEHYTDDIKLSSVADRVHLNPSYLSSLFKQVMNSSFVEYINLTRITKARKLLVSTDATISEIAILVGFRQDEYFYKMFKRLAGLTPTEYRSRYSPLSVDRPAGQ